MSEFSAIDAVTHLIDNLAKCSNESQVTETLDRFGTALPFFSDLTRDKLKLALSSGLQSGNGLDKPEILGAIAALEKMDGIEQVERIFQIQAQELIASIDPNLNQIFPLLAEFIQYVDECHSADRLGLPADWSPASLLVEEPEAPVGLLNPSSTFKR